MVNQVVDGYFGSPSPETSAAWMWAATKAIIPSPWRVRECREVRGVDVRESSLAKAAFVRDALGVTNLAFEQHNCEDLRVEESGPFEVTLFLGILYHWKILCSACVM